MIFVTGSDFWLALGTGYVYGQGAGGNTAPNNADLLVASSTDGGKTWTKPVKVATGTGSSKNKGIFNDKPFVAAWGHGNAVVTWSQFNDGNQGVVINSPIAAAVTHDNGATWTAP